MNSKYFEIKVLPENAFSFEEELIKKKIFFHTNKEKQALIDDGIKYYIFNKDAVENIILKYAVVFNHTSRNVLEIFNDKKSSNINSIAKYALVIAFIFILILFLLAFIPPCQVFDHLTEPAIY